MMVAVIISCILLSIFLFGESKDCLTNPFIYGIENLDDGKLQCQCENDRGGIYEFNGSSFVPKAQHINNLDVNYSLPFLKE